MSLLKCNDNAYFNYTEFNGHSNFNNSRFAANTDFLKVKFKSSEFKNSSFYGEARFAGSTVTDSINFDKTFFLLGQADISSFSAEKVKNNVRKSL